MRTQIIAKIAAYKAFLVGGAAARNDPCGVCSLAQKCLVKLGTLPETAESLSRQLFYFLVLAEANRFGDPVQYRESAQELGLILEKLGQHNPFPWYMKIVSVTSRRQTSGNFGDLTANAKPRFDDSGYDEDQCGNLVHVGTPDEIIGLSWYNMDDHRRFLDMELVDIAHLQGLVD